MKILLITSVLPWPLRRNGGAQRTELLRRSLSQHGTVDVLGIGGDELFEKGCSLESESEALNAADVIDCITIADPVAPILPKLLSLFNGLARTLHHYHSRYETDSEAAATLNKVLAERGPYDLIVSRYLAPAFKVGLFNHKNTPKILDFDDVDWLTLMSSVKANPWSGLTGKIAQWLVLYEMKRTCLFGMHQFNDFWVTCEEDAVLTGASKVLPNIPFFPMPFTHVTSEIAEGAEKQILFVGDLQFPPNISGLDRFISNIFPKIRYKCPEAEFHIVGRGLSRENALKWAKAPGVCVQGFIEDLSTCYKKAAFCVVPIYFGGGTKIKVLEALSFGRTVVATPDALRGYSRLLDAPASVACCTNDNDFANTSIDLLLNTNARCAMATHGQKHIIQNYSFDAFCSAVDNAVNIFEISSERRATDFRASTKTTNDFRE